MRSNGSVTIPSSGNANTIAPAAMVDMADSNDHQNPGMRHIMSVVINPTVPPIRNNQPKNAIPTPGGINTASSPRTMRMIPSIRYSIR